MANMRLVKLKYRPSKGVFVFEYMQEQIERLRGQGKERTVETYQSALNSFMKFRDGIDLCFDEMDADFRGSKTKCERFNMNCAEN